MSADRLDAVHILDGVLLTDRITAPDNGRITAHISGDHRGTVTVYDSDGRRVRTLGYAQLLRFDWTYSRKWKR